MHSDRPERDIVKVLVEGDKSVHKVRRTRGMTVEHKMSAGPYLIFAGKCWAPIGESQFFDKERP